MSTNETPNKHVKFQVITTLLSICLLFLSLGARIIIWNNKKRKENERKGTEMHDAPNFVSEENEPRNIEQYGAEEKEGIGAAEALTATLNCNQSKQRD